MSFHSALLTGAIVLCGICNLAVLTFQLSYFSRSANAPSYTYVGHDHPRELPIDLGDPVAQSYTEDYQHYQIADDPIADEEWNSVFPVGQGIITLGSEGRLFSVAMYHQLHCLNKLRQSMVVGGVPPLHVHHCFNYLRYALLCAADVTLEWEDVESPNDTGVPRIDGVNVTHTCRDWTKVFAETEKRAIKRPPGR